ncbi:MAG TPA: hypothetical protein P5084_08300 [Paludibacter sp.]|nr:hypothetical protein [Paludibacter sp.]
MKTIYLAIGLFLFTLTLNAQNLNIHKTDGSIVTIAVDSIDSILITTNSRNIDEFCKLKPVDWNCETITKPFASTLRPQGADGLVEDPIAVIKYSNSTLGCTNYKSLFLYVYDISKKVSMEEIIKKSMIYSWCTPMFFGENEKYYVITSDCYLYNNCWNNENLQPLFQAIKGLFTRSIIR